MSMCNIWHVYTRIDSNMLMKWWSEMEYGIFHSILLSVYFHLFSFIWAIWRVNDTILLSILLLLFFLLLPPRFISSAKRHVYNLLYFPLCFKCERQRKKKNYNEKHQQKMRTHSHQIKPSSSWYWVFILLLLSLFFSYFG